MNCKECKKILTPSDIYDKSNRYCNNCFETHSNFIKYRHNHLKLLQSLPLELKIKKSLSLIEDAINTYGKDNIYVSYSGGKDSGVLSHLAKQVYPNILHVFSNTTCEYPETLKHIKWEKESNNTNLTIVKPVDRSKKKWNFKMVVEHYGFPMFSKSVSNAIRTYRRAKSEKVRDNTLGYIERNFKKYYKYKDVNISDKCCDRLKKSPIKSFAKKNGLTCSLIGTLAVESRQRKNDWINYGCNVFEVKKDNQCRPLSFWTEKDVLDYIEIYSLRISDLYSMGYKRNGCMFCGFGILHDIDEDGKNRFERLRQTHPKSYEYLINNFRDILDECDVNY